MFVVRGLKIGSGLAVRSLTMALVSIMTAVAGLAFATPAQAADQVEYYKSVRFGGCIHPWAAYDSQAWTVSCDSTNSFQFWRVIGRGYADQTGQSTAHNRLVQLQNVASNRCLDSHGSDTGGIAWVVGCNGGAFQVWEVFQNGNGTITFKSWGAYTLQGGRHRCLRSTNYEEELKVWVCNASNTDQQWL